MRRYLLDKQTDSGLLWKVALWLAGITIGYNLLEGAVSVVFGYSDETLSLFGFGMDSFVEVVSGIGVWHMVVRTLKNGGERDRFEKTALRITGTSFYLLAAGLVATGVYNVITGSKPVTTLWGIVISSISIVTMILLMAAKLRIGRRLNSPSIIADAHCTRTCIYLSVILLGASVLFELFHLAYIDAIGALGIAWYAFTEGRESFEKARGGACGCGSGCSGK